jgi:hypothetical protein
MRMMHERFLDSLRLYYLALVPFNRYYTGGKVSKTKPDGSVKRARLALPDARGVIRRAPRLVSIAGDLPHLDASMTRSSGWSLTDDLRSSAARWKAPMMAR